MSVETVSCIALALAVLAFAINLHSAITDPNRKRRFYSDIRWGIRRAVAEHRGGWSTSTGRPHRLERRAYRRTMNRLTEISERMNA